MIKTVSSSFLNSTETCSAIQIAPSQQKTSEILLTSQKIETTSSSFLNFQRDRKFQSRNSNGRNISTYYFTRKEMTPLLAFLSHLKAIEMSNHVIDTFFASLKFFSSTTFLLKRNITRLSCYSVLSKSTLLTRTMF